MTGETVTDRPTTKWGRRVVAVAAMTALGACTSNETGHSAPATTPRTSSPAAERPTTSAPHPKPTTSKPCKLEGAAMTASIRAKGDVVNVSRQLVGKAIDIEPHTTKGECYEQITFRFDGPKVSASKRPGLHAAYVKTPLKKPSDKPVFVDGKAFLEVTMGSWWYAQGGGEGPTAITSARTDNIKVVQRTQNDEGVTSWTVGLQEKQPFTAQEVSGTAQCPTECLVLKIEQPHK